MDTAAVRQELSGFWYACPEKGNENRAAAFSEKDCVRMGLPAGIAALDPKSKEPVWFYYPFTSELQKCENRRIFLNICRVDYFCAVYLNGQYIGTQCHAEKPFRLDVTEAFREGENLLACRVFSPASDGSEGFMGLHIRNFPNRGRAFAYYSAYNSGGIIGPVFLESRPSLYVSDLHVIPDAGTGDVCIKAALQNGYGSPVTATLSFTVTADGVPVVRERISVSASESGADAETTLHIPAFRLWSPDTPFLYGLNVTLTVNGETDERQLRFGFRSLCVKNGFFYLNGKRIFLKCAHTDSATKASIADAKAMGFNTLRFLAALAPEELIDYCDEIGMLVYDECAVSWGMSDYPEMPEHMKAYLENMLYRDRNHVSVAIYGIFNEHGGPNEEFRNPELPGEKTFDYAVESLPSLRKIDNERLILLSSGRWDGRADIGSLSNPGSDRWEYEWGGEAPDAIPNARRGGGEHVPPYMALMGDVHLYPTVPIQNDVRDFVRRIGEGTKPVFMSEYGVGYQIALEEMYEASHSEYHGVQLRHLNEWIQKYGLSDLYPTAGGFMLASIRAGAEQRRESIDPIRANPQFCGYSLTSFSTGNEGVYFAGNRMIPGIVDALRESFAPLRWCIFTDRTELYENEPLPVEVVLANTDVLPSGEYRAALSVRGEDGVVWRDSVSFTYPAGDPAPLAASVIRCTVPGLPAGNYTFAVRKEGAPQPVCSEKNFRVYPAITEKLSLSVFLFGETYGLSALLDRLGVRHAADPAEADVLIVGRVSDAEERAAIMNHAWKGSRVLILDPHFWDGANTSDQHFMGKIEYSPDETNKVFGACIYVRNWLYHMDNYIADPALFRGIAKPGLLDMTQFRELYPERYLVRTSAPQKTGCAAFGSGLFAQDSCIAALTMGTFAFGSGEIFASTFRLLENIGVHPAADRLIFNLLKQ